MRSWLLVLFVGCASSRSTVVLQVPPSAVVSAIPFTEAEIAAGVHSDPKRLFTWLERIDRLRDEDDVATTLTFSTNQPVLQVFVDDRGDGLDALFDRSTLVRPTKGPITLVEKPPRNSKEPCAGERFEKLTLEGHVLCVFLPLNYDASTKYPVVFVFPGFSGNAVHNDGFAARHLFDKQPVILVGVETRIPEGTAYLNGEWETYVVERVIPEIDRRYPTNGKRAAFGHSTGGWNSLSLAMRHPGLFAAVGASSPDPLDFDVWLASGRERWFHWQRAEQRLGGRGQFMSWSLSWSNRAPLFKADGSLDDEVLAKWKRESPLTLMENQKVPLFITAGRKDMFDLFKPTERFVEAAREKKLDVTWFPTELDHFGETEARFTKLVEFLLERLH
ncbi:MAG: alpha/beta hydrolase [Archangium sp.]